MGAYTFMNELWKRKGSDVMKYQQRLRAWEYRRGHALVRVTRPTRPEKARRMGYKTKNGYSIWRIRVRRGGRHNPVRGGITWGKPKGQGVNHLKPRANLQELAEQRAGKKLGGLRMLSSYWVNEDTLFKYYEAVLVDPSKKAIRSDSKINWIVNPVHKRREVRGLTASGKKHRGLMRNKGRRRNKNAPSRRAFWKKSNRYSLRRYR
jgi:large subunit ribosomal protein L15e